MYPENMNHVLFCVCTTINNYLIIIPSSLFSFGRGMAEGGGGGGEGGGGGGVCNRVFSIQGSNIKYSGER